MHAAAGSVAARGEIKACAQQIDDGHHARSTASCRGARWDGRPAAPVQTRASSYVAVGGQQLAPMHPPRGRARPPRFHPHPRPSLRTTTTTRTRGRLHAMSALDYLSTTLWSSRVAVSVATCDHRQRGGWLRSIRPRRAFLITHHQSSMHDIHVALAPSPSYSKPN